MRQALLRTVVAGLLFFAAVLAGNTRALACTAFCAVGAGQVLVGNNEDWTNPRTRIWFVPAGPGSYGRMYVGFDDLWPQGGMNEHGLWFDGFSAPALKAAGSSGLPQFPGHIVDTAMAECRTVEEVVRLFSQYNRTFLTNAILMFADAAGDAVSIEPNAIVRKTGQHFVQTNFHQSRMRSGAGAYDGRFSTASTMLEQAGSEISIDLFRRILAATHQKGAAPTLYSNVYDLRSRTMHLYYFHDFGRAVTFNLADELKKGRRVLEIPALFPPNTDADAFAARQTEPRGGPGPAAIVGVAALFVCLAFGAAVFAWMRAGRGFRIGMAVLGGALGVIVLLSAVAIGTHRRASESWIEFSIGPASGRSASIGTNAMRSSGITLKSALATAFDIPSVRVIGPPWLATTRYSINAVVDVNDSDSFRSLLKQELTTRMRLNAHVEIRPFDVLVLTAIDAPRLERASGQNVSIRLNDRNAQLQDASMERVAAALESILGKPVVDETGITGSYNMDFGWGDDREATVTATLRDRFGLRLSPTTRNMEALVIEHSRRDPALVLLEQIGRLTSGAPPHIREQIATALAVR